MPHNIFRDVEANRVNAGTMDAESASFDQISGVNTVAATAINAQNISVNTITATNVNFKFGQTRRAFPSNQSKVDMATVGTVTEQYFSFPRKVKVVGLGFQSGASDVVSSTNTALELRTVNGTKIATFVHSAHDTIGTGEATVGAVSTTVATNRGLMITIGTAAYLSGSAYPFIDYQAIS